VIAENEDDLAEWTDGVENGGVEVNMNKAKVMASG